LPLFFKKLHISALIGNQATTQPAPAPVRCLLAPIEGRAGSAEKFGIRAVICLSAQREL
jgi:hypothetical protein